MNKSQEIKLDKTEVKVISILRKIKLFFKSIFKSLFIKILLILIIFGFLISSIFFYMKSLIYLKQGDFEYQGKNYQNALEDYKLADHWWIFEKIHSKFQDSDILEKIKKAETMIRSTDFFEEGKKDFEEESYVSAKWNLSHLATNDPNSSEAQELLKQIEEIEKSKITPTPTVVLFPTIIQNEYSPIETPTPSKGEYNHDSYYPILLSFSDNMGNSVKISDYNNYSGNDRWNTPNSTLKLGDTIYLKAEASDPKGRQVLFNFSLCNNLSEFTTNNTCNHTISKEDLKKGQYLRVFVKMRSDKEYMRRNTYDDEMYFDYQLTPE